MQRCRSNDFRGRPAAADEHEHEHEADRPERPQAEAPGPGGERREPLPAFDRALEDADRKRRQGVGDDAVMIDHRGGAGVGGADHRPLQLERAHARDAQVLLDRDRLAEPADVADVGEDRRRRRLGNEARRELLAEQVLVADVGRDALAVDVERRRRQRAAVEVAERDVHHPREPVKAERDELAERHEVVLVVAVVAARHRRRRHREAERGVGVAVLRVAHRDAEDRRPAGNAKARHQRRPVRVVELAEAAPG